MNDQNRGAWLAFLAVLVAASFALVWWIQQSPPSKFAVDSDGVWRPRISTDFDTAEPADARSDRRFDPPQVDRAGSWEWMNTQPGSDEPVTYDPCVPIHVEINPRTGPAHGIELVVAAIGRTQAATGLEFVVDSATVEEPTFGETANTTEASVLIGWSDPDTLPELEGNVAGLGGSAIGVHEGRHFYMSGEIALDGPDLRDASDAEIIALTMHELGHVVGLGHTDAFGELMNAENSGQLDWGPGDRYALATLGSGPCIDR